MLENIAGDWSQVLDLFSGSGALGIEALSRGAGWVDFVESEPRCCGIIKENLEKTKLAARALVHCRNVENLLSFLDKEYNIILMDPPYSNPSIVNLVKKLADSKLQSGQHIEVRRESVRLPGSAFVFGQKAGTELGHPGHCGQNFAVAQILGVRTKPQSKLYHV